jgi:hypothetical protein
MAENLFNQDSNFLLTSDTNSFDQSGAGVIIGGGGSVFGGGGSSPTPIPQPSVRTISFNLNSSPVGSSIFVDGIDTKFTTPHTLQFTETELLTPKVLSVKTSNRTSNENYVISSEMIEQNFGGGGGSGGGGGTLIRDPGTGFGREIIFDDGSERRENIK